MGKRGNGEGSIRQRADDSWEARVTIAGISRSFYGRTRQDANKKLIAALRDRDRGLPIVRDERQTLAQYLPAWLETMKPPVIEPRTWERYEQFVRVHFVPALGKTQLAKLSAQAVQQLYTGKLAEGSAASTVRQMHVVLHEALDMALRHGLVARNVTDHVDKPKVSRQEMRVWEPSQVRTFLEVVQGERLAALYRLALATGLRQGELLGLCWRNVDLDDGILQVQTNLQKIKDQGHQLRNPKTHRSRRKIRLTSSDVAALRAHRVHQLEERVALGPSWQEQDLVFPDEAGRPLSNYRLYRQFLSLVKRADVPLIRFHDLRHTAATLLLLQGINVKVVSEMLGHSSIAITLDLYGHVLPDMQQQAADAMERILRG